MKDSEFQTWRKNNLLIGLVGVAATIVGTWMNFSGHSNARWIVVGGVIWYVFFYLRYIVVRRWYEGDQLETLLEQYHELRGTNRVLRTELSDGAQLNQQTQTRHEHQLYVLRTQIELATRRHLLRDINIATILTRRFVILALHRFATQYRHELVNPILDMIRNGVIRENAVITHLDEPAAFADVVLARKEELKATCPKLIDLCKDHWSTPDGEPGSSAPALPPDGLASFQ